MSSTSDPLSGAPLSVIAGVLEWMRYGAVTSPALLVYDTLLTLDDEIRLVWPGPLSLAKAMYYINRYLAMVTVIYSNYYISGFHPPLSQLSCYTWLWSTAAVYILKTTVATGMLCMRVVALYQGVRWVIWTLWVSFVLSEGTRVALNIWGSSLFGANLVYSHIGRQCLAGSGVKANGPANAIIVGVLPTVLDLLLLALTVAKALRAAFSHSHPSSRIMRALLSHEILYFFVIVIIRACAVTVLLAFPSTLTTAVANVEWGVESALISRFFLHLRVISSTREDYGLSQTAVSSHTRSFGRRTTRLTNGFTFKAEAETSIYSGFPNKNERGIRQAETVDAEGGIELRTRYDGGQGDKNYTRPLVE